MKCGCGVWANGRVTRGYHFGLLALWTGARRVLPCAVASSLSAARAAVVPCIAGRPPQDGVLPQRGAAPGRGGARVDLGLTAAAAPALGRGITPGRWRW